MPQGNHPDNNKRSKAQVNRALQGDRQKNRKRTRTRTKTRKPEIASQNAV